MTELAVKASIQKIEQLRLEIVQEAVTTTGCRGFPLRMKSRLNDAYVQTAMLYESEM